MNFPAKLTFITLTIMSFIAQADQQKQIEINLGRHKPVFSLGSITVENKSDNLDKALFKKYEVTKPSESAYSENSESVIDRSNFINSDVASRHYGFHSKDYAKVAKKKWSKVLKNVEGVKHVAKADEAPATQYYDVNDPNAVRNFKNDEDISAILDSVESGKNKKVGKDDLVFYNYGSAGKKEVVDSIQHVAAAPLPIEVQKVIEREMTNKGSRKPVKNKKVKPFKLLASKSDEEPDGQYISLSVSDYNLDGGLQAEEEPFQFKPLYNESPLVDENGRLRIVADSGVIRGAILKHGTVATNVEIPVNKEQDFFNVPLLSYDSVRNFLDKHELNGVGGMYLADVSSKIEDVDIEAEGEGVAYESRVFLDDEMREVKVGSSFRYILFIGVVGGNNTIKILSRSGELSEKMTLITPDEVLFDYLDVERTKNLTLDLEIKNTLSNVTSKLNIKKDKLKDFITGDSPKKDGEGRYVMSHVSPVVGMKKYLELDYLSDKIFIGIEKNKKVEVPSNEFVLEVMKQFDLVDSGLLDRCLLQVNLDKATTSADIALESDNGVETFDVFYLDNDGIFTDEISPITKKMFVLGYRQGLINLRIKTIDNKTKYLRSYCSNSTYLLEHL